MELRKTKDNGDVTVEISGELDHHAAQKAMWYLENTIDLYTPARLILDLSHLKFMDSSGIAVVMKANRAMSDMGGAFMVINTPAQAKKVFSAAALQRLISIE